MPLACCASLLQSPCSFLPNASCLSTSCENIIRNYPRLLYVNTICNALLEISYLRMNWRHFLAKIVKDAQHDDFFNSLTWHSAKFRFEELNWLIESSNSHQGNYNVLMENFLVQILHFCNFFFVFFLSKFWRILKQKQKMCNKNSIKFQSYAFNTISLVQ